MNKILSLIAFFVIIYFEFSIFVLDKLMVGQIGFLFSQFSHNYFGYISYIYLFIFVYILYKINFKKTTSLDLTLRVCTLTTLLFSFIIFQTLILEDSRAGILGNAIVLTLSPFIGNAGLWIFMFIGVFIFLMVFLENKKEEFSNNIRNLLIGYKPKAKIVPTKDYRYTKNMQNDKKEDKITIKEVGDTAEIVIEVPKNKEKVFEKFDQDIEDADIIENDDNTPHALMVDELEENKKLLDEIELGKNEKPKDFKLPSTAFFQEPPKEKKAKVNEVFIDKKIADLLEKLLMFKIEGDVVRTYTGPIVTTFEFKPAPNVKVSKILNLQDDLAMALKAQTIRIQAPIPGKDVVGIEVPNEDSQVIYIRELLESEIF
ncbi:MAG: DNA translocase FtsK 4TM domain-containing protein, partial [Arcobacteraceae bacterium]